MKKLMSSQFCNRIKLGQICEEITPEGDIKKHFEAKKDVWAYVKSISLTKYLPQEVWNERETHFSKNSFHVVIRKSCLKGKSRKVWNALLFKEHVYVQSFPLREDEKGMYLEGLYYMWGENIND